MVKLANNTYVQLGVFMSSAMVVQTIGANQSAYAVEFNNPSAQHLFNFNFNAKKGLGSVQSQYKTTFLPQISDRLAFPFKSYSVDFAVQSDKIQPVSTILLSQSQQPNSAFNNQELYLANTQQSLATPSLIHQVQPGDTIFKIAREYQVSTNELIELNQLPNSNVIFVDQRLQIPPTEAQNKTVNSAVPPIADLTINNNSVNSPQPKINKLEQKSEKINVVSSAEEDPRIAKLRAEIDRLRAQYNQKPKADERINSASLVSVTDRRSKQRAKSNSQPTSATAKLNSPSPQRNLQSNLIKPNALALKLPPLSNPDAYLPNAFEGYAWPAQGVITSGYGLRWGRMHQGIDIAAPVGTPVLAAAAGTVIGAGWHDGYGNLIELEHADGSVTYYGHNNRNLVTPGQQVEQGEQIAEMGSTGNSTGSHLHFEIRLSDEQVVDPITLLSDR